MLADVQRELRAARWDRSLAQAAAVLLIVGVGLNLSIGMRSMEARGARQQIIGSRSQSLVDTAVVVAEATDVTTGRRFVHQLAAIAGVELTNAEVAAIDAALEPTEPQTTKGENRG